MRTVLTLCICLLTISCLAQEDAPISHKLEGIQQQIDQADQGLDNRKKELANDPSLQAAREDFLAKKAASDGFYQTTNKKLPNGSSELAQAQGQQHALDDAANAARERLKSLREELYAKDRVLDSLNRVKRDLESLRRQIMTEATIMGKLLGLPCSLSGGVMAVRACLDQIFDGMRGRPTDPVLDDPDRLNGPIIRGTPFFHTIQGSGGPAVIMLDAPVIDPALGDAKKQWWAQYLSTHKGFDQANAFQEEAAWEKSYFSQQNSTGTANGQPAAQQKPLVLKNTLTPKTTHYVEPPSPPPAAPSTIEILNKKAHEILQRIQQMEEPIRQSISADVLAVRG